MRVMPLFRMAKRHVRVNVLQRWRMSSAGEGTDVKEERKRELLAYLVPRLEREHFKRGGFAAGRLEQLLRRAEAPNASTEDLWLAFRGLVNVREVVPAYEALLAAQDELLQGMIAEAGITQVADTQPAPEFRGIPSGRIRLWRGDITTLAADAIVNAASSGMTGYWAPLHYCIDNRSIR